MPIRIYNNFLRSLDARCFKKFEFESSGHFKNAKAIGYKVGRELLKKAGADFTVEGN